MKTDRDLPGAASFIRKWVTILLFLIASLLLTRVPAYSLDIAPQQEGICGPDVEASKECINVPSDSGNSQLPLKGEEKKKQDTVQKPARVPAEKETGYESFQQRVLPGEVIVYFFWGRGCPHCEEEKVFLEKIKKRYPALKIMDYEVWYHSENAEMLTRMASEYKTKFSGVPATFIGGQTFFGFSKHSAVEISETIQGCLSSGCIDPGLILSGKVSIDDVRSLRKHSGEEGETENLECTAKSRTVYIPWIGSLDASGMSLPVITLVIAGLDSFNPCAFFVLFSLLGLLIHARSRQKMLLIGSIFVFFSGFVYFLFMAAWLNLFLVLGQVDIMTTIAGSIAVLIAAINIKDFFIFKKGVSLTIPDSAKPKLFDRMRKLMKSTSLVSIIIGTTVLAVAANAYELLCTAGFPMVFTRILTLNNLSTPFYYLYLILYNLIYVIPLSIIVVIFTITLGKKNLTEWQGRIMKLISGTMMLGLGGVLILDPAVLSNALISLLLLAGALVISVMIAFATKQFGHSSQ